jgi:hypothetical protein
MRFFGKTGITRKMTTSLPRIPCLILLVLVALPAHLHAQVGAPVPAFPQNSAAAAPSPVPGPASTPPADVLLARAILFLENYHSILANVSYQANILGHELGGKGDYREQRTGPRPKVRLVIQMPLGDKMGAMVELSDSRYLWNYLRLADDEKLTRVDIERVARETGNPDGAASAVPLTGSIGIGGLAGLVRELRRNFRFDVLGPSQFLGEPTWQLVGHWRPEQLAVILPDNKDAIRRGESVDLEKLPAHLPNEVVLTLGRDNLLPYRVEYRRIRQQPDKDRLATPAAANETILVIEWFSIGRNEPINPSDFEYRPGDIEILDATESLIERIKSRPKPPTP